MKRHIIKIIASNIQEQEIRALSPRERTLRLLRYGQPGENAHPIRVVILATDDEFHRIARIPIQERAQAITGPSHQEGGE
jgi:hypothetical protein